MSNTVYWGDLIILSLPFRNLLFVFLQFLVNLCMAGKMHTKKDFLQNVAYFLLLATRSTSSFKCQVVKFIFIPSGCKYIN